MAEAQQVGWVDEVVSAINALGGVAHYSDIYAKIEKNTTRRLGKEWKAVVRRTIEEHSSDTTCKKSANFADLFFSANGLGKGTWGVRKVGKTSNFTLSLITNVGEVDRLQALFVRAFKVNTKTILRRLGNPGEDHGPHKLYWNSHTGIWGGPFRKGETRYWNPFGIGLFPAAKAGTMVVQLNPSRTGHKNTSCAFLSDAQSGQVFVAHRGTLGGTYAALTKDFFKIFNGPVVDVVDGDSAERYAVVSALNDEDLAQRVAAFVREVARVKSVLKGEQKGASLSLEALEFKGAKKPYNRSGYVESFCSHGTVVNALIKVLEKHQAGRDRFRDVFFPKTGPAKVLFEVKTDVDPYSIYTGVGQLMVHGRGHNSETKLALLTPSMPTSQREQLKAVGIHSVLYSISDDEVRFEFLDEILASVS